MSAQRNPRRDRAIARSVAEWYEANARELPWRLPARDPYKSLVSEIMLQQTQISRVLEKFEEFLERFPTLQSLAEADEHDVLAAWSGLGYYRRARLLHKCAQQIVSDHGGEAPRDVDALRKLAGIGRYTAGAIASMVFDQPAPIVDGNVQRVFLRLHGVDAAPTDPGIDAWCWERAEELVEAGAKDDVVAAFNEGLMELGGTICKPASPSCDACPLKRRCAARRDGAQNDIPRPKATAVRRRIYHTALLVRDGRGRTFVHRRDPAGLWAGMWQAPTIERDDKAPTKRDLAARFGVDSLALVSKFEHQTTHRIVEFKVYEAASPRVAKNIDGAWKTRRQLEGLALSNVHRKILLNEAGSVEELAQGE